MEPCVDRSIGALKYTSAVLVGRNRSVTRVVEFLGDTESDVVGDFGLTISKSMVILTNNSKPIIAKRWVARDVNGYILEKGCLTPYLIAGIKIAEIYQDSDGWIWEGIVDSDGNHFQVKSDDEYLYTISFT